jgi:hypothetical protein
VALAARLFGLAAKLTAARPTFRRTLCWVFLPALEMRQQALLLYLTDAFLSTRALAGGLYRWLEAVLFPDQLTRGGMHEFYELLGEVRIVGLVGKGGQYLKGGIELVGDGKL